MLNLFRSKIFLRYFLYFLLIICVTFLALAYVLLTVTKISLKNQQTDMVENYRVQASHQIQNWLEDNKNYIKGQALNLQILGQNTLGSAELQVYIRNQMNINRNLVDFLILNDTGQVVNSLDGDANHLNLSDRIYFINGIQGKSTVTQFYKSAVSGHPIMAIGEPIFFNNQPRYVLAGIIELQRVKEIVENQDFNNWGHAYLVNEDGVLITDSEFIRDFINHGEVKEKDKFRIDTFAVRQILQKRSGTGSYIDFMGQGVIGSYEWLEPLQVGLVVEFNSKNLMRPINDLIRVIWILAFVIVIIGTVLAFLLSRRIVEPIKLLVNSIENIIRQDYQQPIEMKTNSELDTLIDYFNVMQSALHEREEHLKEMAMKDSLTGIFNHALLIELLEKELVKSKRQVNNISFCMLDIDYFKKINDTYGHSVGDIVLKELTGILVRTVRKCDIIGRYGGEEFGIVFPDIGREEAIQVCERIRNTVETYKFCAGHHMLHVTVSAGICFKEAGMALNYSEMINQADQALYCAKRNGRNRVVMFREAELTDRKSFQMNKSNLG